MQKRRRVVVVGAGGHARVVAWILRDLAAAGAPLEFAGYVVSDLAKLGPRDSRDGLLGDLDWLDAHRADFDALTLGVGTPAPRLRLSTELSQRFPEFDWPTLVHPSVVLDRATCEFGPGAVVCPGVVASVNATIEPFAMINYSCTLGHEARIGRGSVLNPSVNVSGGVTIGTGVMVGVGAQILQYLDVGDGAVVGAGSVVTKNVPAGARVVGIPASPMPGGPT